MLMASKIGPSGKLPGVGRISVPVKSQFIRGFALIIRCSGCQTTFSFATEPPKFCQECGHSLKDEETLIGEDDAAVAAAGVASMEAADVTIAPSTSASQQFRGLQAGERIENYELINILGSGGMGVVWKAVDTNNGRQVALKRLSKNHLSDQDSVTRFMREAQLASKMSHPRVTFVYSAGRLDEQPFIAMELMPGETLADRVKNEGPLPVGEAVDKILDVIDGLDAAHEMGLIHRDVKPSNCFVDSDDRVKIGDFGLSKSVIGTDIELTRTGTFMGTPAYAAPEQIRGEKLDNRTDIYAVGATLCNLLTGRAPFVGDAMTVTAQIITDEPKIVGEIPRELVRILKQCLEKHRPKRYQTLKDLKNALLPFAQSQNSLAAIGRRVSAYMIDVVLVGTGYGIVLAMFGIYAGITSKTEEVPLDDLLKPISWIGPIVGFVVPILYFTFLEALKGKTIGKRVLGLKVVDHEGANPSWGRAFLRAFFIPGGAAIPLLLGLIILSFWPMTTSPIDTTIRTAVNLLVAVVPLMTILSPIIRQVGNEGWHEIISGTRVISDGQTDTGYLLIPDPKPQCAKSTFMLGPYRVGQILQQSEGTTVYLGVDPQLDRNVWVHCCEGEDCPPTEQRILLARVARQRWLDGGFTDGKRWDAFEAIEGLPVQTVVGSRYDVGWPEYQKMLKDVAEELKTAMNDGTLPSTLSLPQVWLDRNGHAKIIDRSLVDVVNLPDRDPRLSMLDTVVDFTATKSDIAPQAQGPVQLIKALGKSVTKGEPLPLSAQDFLNELESKPDTDSTLSWAIERLKGFAGKLGKIDWETRVGILGITVGFEFMLYTIVSSFLYLLAFYLIPLPTPSRYFIGLALSLIIPVAMGVIFSGGAIFHFMEVTVTSRKGQRIGFLKQMSRSFLSWLPAMAGVGAWLVCIVAGNGQMNGIEPEPGSLTADFREHLYIPVSAFLIILVTFFIQLVGVLIVLISPTRGLQDYLNGTRLLPK